VARAEGPGFKLGERLVLHLGLGVQITYDNNIFFQSQNETGSFQLVVLPSFDMATRARNVPHTIDFRLHGAMEYTEYLTGDANISQHRSFGVQAGGLLTIMPGHKVSIDILDNYVRSVQPPYAAAGVAPSYNIDRDVNQVGLRLNFRPGGERLHLMLSYTFGIDFFENPIYQPLDVETHRTELRLSWKFFPKTALYLDAVDTPYIYPHPDPTNPHPNSYPLQIVLGVQGLITPKLTVNVYVGYGNGFYVSGPNPNTGVGGLSLSWKPFYSAAATLAYRHDFQNSLLGSYYDLDTASVSWAQLLWRFMASVALSYSNIRYQGIPATALSGVNPPNRTDNFVSLNVRFEYPFKRWLSLSLGYIMQYNNASSKLDLGPLGVIPADYLKHSVYLRLQVLY
jgi:hypothetical protein